MGPWEEATKGVIFKQETVWESLEVTGASFVGAGWSDPVTSWHNKPVTFSMQTTADKPVTVRVSARPKVPTGFVEPRRVTNRISPAHLAARQFMHGANFGNDFEVPRF